MKHAVIDDIEGVLIQSAGAKTCSRPGAGLAQLVEHLICNQRVGGSSPSTGTKFINDLNDNQRLLLEFVSVWCPFNIRLNNANNAAQGWGNSDMFSPSRRPIFEHINPVITNFLKRR